MCWKCGKPIDNQSFIGRDTVCPSCGNYLRACKNCRFYEPSSHYECHETVDERVSDKESANFCDYFSVKTSFGGNSTSSTSDSKEAKARNAFNSLFGD